MSRYGTGLAFRTPDRRRIRSAARCLSASVLVRRVVADPDSYGRRVFVGMGH
jgi:hypothetical protein